LYRINRIRQVPVLHCPHGTPSIQVLRTDDDAILDIEVYKAIRSKTCSPAFSPTAIMLFSTVLSLATLVCVSNALPTSSVVLEKIESSPPGWVVDHSANIDRDATTITLKIHLVNQGMDVFHKLAMEVS
jgi:hypothetical protein